MAYYGFRLDELNVRYQRGKVMDNDVVSFAVTVNDTPHGGIVGQFNVGSGERVPASAVQPGVQGKFGLNFGGWIVGPIWVEPGDSVEVRYSGVNISDTPQTADQVFIEKVELPLLGALYGAGITGIVGGVAGTLAGLAGGFTNIIKTALGDTGPHQCNGTVFVDVKLFTGSALAAMSYTDVPGLEAGTTSFSNSYDDSATHDADQCGHIAETDVTFSILKYDALSVSFLRPVMYPKADLRKGFRQLVPAGQATSLRALLCT